MTIATTAMLNVLADAYAGEAAYLSCHSDDPGTSGANEASGGSPAYARKALTWGDAADGVTAAAQVTFDLAANQAVAYIGVWSASTGGDFLDKVQVTYTTQASQSQLKVTATYTQS